MFENPRRGRQARNFTTNVPKILDLRSSSEQIFSENSRWVPLKIATELKANNKSTYTNRFLASVLSKIFSAKITSFAS